MQYKKSTKYMTTLLLTIFMVGILFMLALPTVVQASTTDVSNNIDVTVTFNGSSWNYNLASNVKGLSQQQQLRRGVGACSGVKWGVYNELIASGYTEQMAREFILPRFREFVENINKTVAVDKVDSTVTFNKSGNAKFSYSEFTDGRKVDDKALFNALIEATGSGKVTVELPVAIDKAVTIDQLKANTVVRGKFTTYFGNKANRVGNIKRACELLRGTIVGAGEQFSFNESVGERTIANGFYHSTVISDGVYTDGVGGGVCQVSTTLYNCALLAVMDIVVVNQHSLVPHYVEPSFDAMVSYPNADLKFVNTSSSPIYIDAVATNSAVTVTVYGSAHHCTVERISSSERIPFTTKTVVDSSKYPQLQYSDERKVVVSGSDGVTSTGKVIVKRNGKVISEKVRKNKYKMVEQIVATGEKERPESDN